MLLRQNANQLELSEPLVVTKNGKPNFVVQSYEDFQYTQDSIALLKLLKLSEKNVKSQGSLSLAQVFEDE